MKSFSFVSVALVLVLSSLSPSILAIEQNSTSSLSSDRTQNDTNEPSAQHNSYGAHDPLLERLIFSWLDWDVVSALVHKEILSFEIPSALAGQGFKATEVRRRRLQGELAEDENNSFDPDDLIVSVTFSDIYKVIIFIGVAWLLGEISIYIGLPSLVGEIMAGFLLGPPLADFVPYPGALVLTGNLGLIGLILESGIALDVDQLKENAGRALLLAIVGSALPLLTGFGIGRWIGMAVKPAIAVGAAFAPSSLGVASNALSSGDVLNTPIGQTIVAASVFDDVFGLILLSILEVFADPNPPAFAYILPFIASFGYLIVLGILGIMVFPRIMQDRILPLVSEGKRDEFAMVLMIILMVGYMLALNYSGASFLTGVFLAGLTFSQLQTVHAWFVKHGRPLLDWLLRIFFAATIGFQVPVTRFQDVFVQKWGLCLLLAVFAKVPLGFLVPHHQKEIPLGFPYNPHVRDVVVTSLAMTCRGEFNVIVASYALSEGLFDADIYSSVIFAILFGSIVSPLVLTRVLRYYNNLSTQYLDGKHPIERIGNTCDGYRPLYLAIQARTPVQFNLQEDFKRVLEEGGLIIIDHRSWHTLGTKDIAQDAVDITELFVQDTKVTVRISGCFGSVPSSRTSESGSSETDDDRNYGEGRRLPINRPDPSKACVEEGFNEEERITARCEEIKEALSLCLKSHDPNDYIIQVSQWQTFVVDRAPSGNSAQSNRKRFYTFTSFPDFDTPDDESTDEIDSIVNGGIVGDIAGVLPKRKMHKRSVSFPDGPIPIPDHHGGDGPSLSGADLWDNDNTCQEATRTGYTMSPNCQGYGGRNMTEGLGDDERSHVGRRERSFSLDPGALVSQRPARDREVTVIKDRLHGYVRRPSAHHASLAPNLSHEFDH